MYTELYQLFGFYIVYDLCATKSLPENIKEPYLNTSSKNFALNLMRRLNE